jgi:hypothetical protein
VVVSSAFVEHALRWSASERAAGSQAFCRLTVITRLGLGAASAKLGTRPSARGVQTRPSRKSSAERLLRFREHYRQIAQTFNWTSPPPISVFAPACVIPLTAFTELVVVAPSGL